MHVEAEQPQIRERGGRLRNRKSFVKGDPELHPLLARAGVRMRSVHQHLGIHTERDGSRHIQPLGDRLDYVELLFRFYVEQKYPRVQSFLDLILGLADATEDNVFAMKAGLEGAVQLATRHYVESGA